MSGLIIYDAEGSVLYERGLEVAVVEECIRFALEHGLTLTAYCGERIVTQATNHHTDRLIFYREPTPEGMFVCALRTDLDGMIMPIVASFGTRGCDASRVRPYGHLAR
jgi:hypothetical protein